MSQLTIKAIKAQLQDIHSIEVIKRQGFYNDERKGVQQAIKRRISSLEKAQALQDKYEAMTHYENEILKKQPEALICGIDEVGRGPLAGPVVASAVILEAGHQYIGIDDSKKLSLKKRLELNEAIHNQAKSVGIGVATVEEIDQLNIYVATQLAMKRAIEGLNVQPTYLLVDAMELPIDIPQTSIVKGDAKSVSIAAASVVAKTYRDNYMVALASKYPGYAFEKNVGYGTKAHLEGLDKLGVTPEHRKTFEPIKSMINRLF
ncbi:ribonuclease HII [Staphylococcus massiliensis]|uniref:Ribonuclease HII n=1 Tax=Staphylococcus massiliensis S46 TaxID=1229783 RepID=K9AWJ4_9STAP|nr:ribonuclease HII [Staphylococcus massiliensis]EKU50461.1 ribonuclease HII [Staphylococcus massiliensis S46]MCG3398768.1 ribonuclease HII [Staphylococcus massiliensis]MCG3401329.1 ribonuclease HII [Staphylococcus massiliensis]MCG3411889.1 ribonuclease HII [Staphylococcus massiliensis]POA00465.1 ribonuclease HII [Staphylococcus massiliensis CCUG 55927]